MTKLLGAICGGILFLVLLSGCVSSECDEPLQDYNQDGSVGAADYDIMKKVETECMKGY
ncbi:hypothetical protein IEN91_05315 [Bacillus velezensis]|uniref:hypothetical protein n=1 Tax=Bacillus velezensis TaxID=492670 RepID=UPI0018C67571|nr:hypothetical protein [Bacillus velezensis]QPK89858.1 hypothetical protein IEN91_05315 [Bacillus velezensis]